MNAIRILTKPETNGELVLKNLPVKKDQVLEVIILTQEESEEDELILSVLQHDPGFAFLRESTEDIYCSSGDLCICSKPVSCPLPTDGTSSPKSAWPGVWNGWRG